MRIIHTNYRYKRIPDFHLHKNPFEFLYPHQKEILKKLLDGKSLHVTKCRQIGLTTTAILFAKRKIQNEGVRPHILTFGNYHKHTLEDAITRSVSCDDWKSLPVGWVMIDETEFIQEDAFLGYNMDFVFSYSSIGAGIPSSFYAYSMCERITYSIHSVPYLFSNRKKDTIKNIIGKKTFGREYECMP